MYPELPALNTELVLPLTLIILIFILAWTRRLPEPWAIKQYLSALNDRGGNILILLCLSSWFFKTAVRMFYFAYQAMVDKKLDPENAILMMGLQFSMGTAFGGTVAVLYKTMTGSDSVTRGSDGPRPPATLVIPPGASGSLMVPPATPGGAGSSVSVTAADQPKT